MPTVYERHVATVTKIHNDSADPTLYQHGLIYASCPSFSGDEEELPIAIEPLLDWGLFVIPDVGEEIEIEALIDDGYGEARVERQALLEYPILIWRGKRYRGEEGEAPRLVPAAFKTNYGKRRGFWTPTGHFLLFDDTKNAEEMQISVRDKNGVEQCQIRAQHDGTVTIKATIVSIEAGTLITGAEGAQSPLARYNELKAHIDTHTHPTAFGPSGAPLVPLPADIATEE